MKIELIFCVLEEVEDDLTIKDLANLTTPVKIDYVEEKIEFVLRMVSSCDELLQVVQGRLNDARGANCVVISDQLVKFNQVNQSAYPSAIAKEVFRQVRDRNSTCGLIALTQTIIHQVQGIDASVFSGRKWRKELRQELKKITVRLLYKKPPSNLFQRNKGHFFSVETEPVSSRKALFNSLELRGRVYNSLGYIDCANEELVIEMDAYDLTSLHFMALDQTNRNKIAGTMRLIVPGLNYMDIESYRRLLSNYEHWSKEIAGSCEDRQWWRAIQRVTPNAIPVMGVFQYFDISDQTLKIDKTIMPRNVCELSRVIVDPEYRGMGVSKQLINHAIKVSKELKRKYLWLECAPHHIKMYQKYGFVVKHHQGEVFYERPQRLDTWAVAMYLDLTNIKEQKTSENAICYRLQIADKNGKSSSLMFQFVRQTAAEIEKIFDSPVTGNQIPGYIGSKENRMSLKKLIPFTLTCHDIENFIHCLKNLMTRVNVERLSLQSSSGRTYCFNPHDINSNKRKIIESGLLQWLR